MFVASKHILSWRFKDRVALLAVGISSLIATHHASFMLRRHCWPPFLSHVLPSSIYSASLVPGASVVGGSQGLGMRLIQCSKLKE